MPIWYSPPEYVVGLLLWIALLALAVRWLLRRRRARRAAGRPVRGVHVALSAWMLLAALTAGEIAFALFVDHSDTFNVTNVSKRWFERHVESQRNQFGARDREEFEKTPPVGRQRIAFVGDSFTMGHGVADVADRFSDRVAAGLEAARPGEFCVANLADAGLDLSQIEARVHGTLRAGYRIQHVVYVLCLNDIDLYDPKIVETISSLQHLQPKNPLLSRTYFLNWLYYRGVQAASWEARNYLPLLREAYAGPPWDGFSAKLLGLRDRCREHRSTLRVVVFPLLTKQGPDGSFAPVHAQIVEFCGRNGIDALDLLPAFADRAGEDLTVNRFDGHPNPRAHAIAADAILAWLEPRLGPEARRSPAGAAPDGQPEMHRAHPR